MMRLFVRRSNVPRNGQRLLETSATAPLRLDACGEIAPENGRWAISFVPFGSERGAGRCCLVVAPGVRATLGANRPPGGVALLHDRDHVLLDDLELICSDDALPIPLGADAATPCAACCQAAGTDDRTGLFRCPRCGLAACSVCWDLAPKGRCLTPGCAQPAALTRPLWAPTAGDFLLAGLGEDGEGEASA